MDKTHQIVIRTRQSNIAKRLTDFGHVGLTLIDNDGQETHFDFAGVIAHKRYHKLSSQFERQASYASLSFTMVATGLVSFVAASLATDNATFSMASSFLMGPVGGFLTAPIKAVKLKREGSEESHEKDFYPKTNQHFMIDVTEEQYNRVLEKLENYDPQLHVVGFYNCVHKAKYVLRDEGVIDLNHTFYDSPNRTIAQLITPAPHG